MTERWQGGLAEARLCTLPNEPRDTLRVKSGYGGLVTSTGAAEDREGSQRDCVFIHKTTAHKTSAKKRHYQTYCVSQQLESSMENTTARPTNRSESGGVCEITSGLNSNTVATLRSMIFEIVVLR